MEHKALTVLVTGATDGLGKCLAKHFARAGASVILHGRDKAKGERVLDELYTQTRNDKLQYYNGDYASLHDVLSLSEEILNNYQHIDILINNAGIGTSNPNGNKRELSADGVELRFAVNYLAHVLLTEKLLPLFKTEFSQIINIASIGQNPIDFSNLMLENSYNGFLAYKQSKTALIMYTLDLADKLTETPVRVNAIHPASLMNTKMALDDWGYAQTTVKQGLEAVTSLLSVKTTGEYYDGKRISKAIPQVYDQKARRELENITLEFLAGYL